MTMKLVLIKWLAPASPSKIISTSLIICIAAVVSPFLYWPLDIRSHDKQRIVEAISLTLIPIAIWFSDIRSRRQTVINFGIGTVPIYLLAFFVLGLLSCFYAYNLRFALYEWSSFVLLLAAAWVIALEINTLKESLLDSLMFYCGLGCALYIFRVILIYIGVWLIGGQPVPQEFIFGFDNIRFFNHTQTVSLPILLLLTIRSKWSDKWYRFWFIVTSLWWAMLFVSGGRGTFVGVAAGVAASLIFRRKPAAEWCRTAVHTFVVGAVIYILFFVLFPHLQGLRPFGYLSFEVDKVVHHLNANPTNNRLALWGTAWQLITTHPWLGAGPLHFAHYTNDHIGDAAHPHDWVLQIAAEWGIPALVCLVVAICLAFRSLLRTERFIPPTDDTNQATLCAWITIGAAVLVDGMISGLIVMPASQLWIALYIGCAWGWASVIYRTRSSDNQCEKPERKLRLRYTIIIMAFCALLALFWNGLFPEVIKLSEVEANALKSSSYLYGAFRPRIWLAGYF